LLASFQIGRAPAGESFLVIGHEAVGQVIAVGAGVNDFRPGDWIVPTVRRACHPPCPMCARGRRDLCTSFDYTERGIVAAHGYFCELAVDAAADLVPLPPALAEVAILIEPLSVVEKAVETALRLHPGEPRTALVVGAGPVGLLAGMTLAARGLAVTIHSRESAGDIRAKLAGRAGLRYETRAEALEPADIAIEAAGAPEAAFLAIDRLGTLGVCAILGSREGSGAMPFLRMILHNQTIFGSVNAGPESFRRAVEDLQTFDRGVLDAMLHRVGMAAFPNSLENMPDNAVKTVHFLD
jgi:threonine dehydrogenase-like Zn-dependent dehydrogenase